MIHTYKDAEDYLFSLIRPTIFTRTEEEKVLTDPLERMRVLLHHLGNPHKSFPSIHVSGTSGKGSTSYFISRFLEEAGYKTGLMISPHLEKITERIQIHNESITDGELVILLNEIQPIVEKMKKERVGQPSYFEVLVACSFLAFEKAKIDIAVVEVGLEGKFDATNVLNPLVGVLTNISLDHTAVLGNSIEQIASEAVSFITEGMQLVTGVTQLTVQRIISDTVLSKKASTYFLHRNFDYDLVSSSAEGSIFSWHEGKVRADMLELNMPGLFQVENASLAIEAVSKLNDFVVTGENIRFALANSFFPGRFEIVNGNIIIDGAHNTAKMQGFTDSLRQYYPYQRKIFIISFKKRKEIESMLPFIMSLADEIIVTSFSPVGKREYLESIDPEEIKKSLEKLGFTQEIKTIPHVKDAILEAKTEMKSGELLVITGSLYLVGEARKILRETS